jgi:NAD(P)-dependent dehydrogenase (short-subunit alcohol dehydrogenase family)
MSEFLQNKVAVVTGANRGLGRAMAQALATEGARVVLVARDQAKLEEAEALCPGSRVYRADLTNEAEVRELGEWVKREFGEVHILINSAGVNLRKPLVEFTREEWDWVMDTNVTSVFLMCRALIPLMTPAGWGRIINLTSIMSHVSLPGRTAYSSSKTALLGLTRALALELAPDGIRVSAISPGPFATEMNTALINDPEANRAFLSKIPVGEWGRPADIGSLVLFLCSPAADFMTGSDIVIDGGWLAQ